MTVTIHDDVIKWKPFLRYWPFVRGIPRSPVNSSHKGQWRGALMFTLICHWINCWINNHEAGDLRRYRAHYDVTVMKYPCCLVWLMGYHSLNWTHGGYLSERTNDKVKIWFFRDVFLNKLPIEQWSYRWFDTSKLSNHCNQTPLILFI